MKTALCLVTLASSIAFSAVPKKEAWRPSAASVAKMLALPLDSRQQTLKEQPDSVYKTLMEIAFDDLRPMAVRWKALTSGAQLRREQAIPDLMKATKHREWYMRNAGLVSLAEVAPAKSRDVAKDLLKDKALVVRSAAVDALAKNMTPATRDLLWEELAAPRNQKNGQSLWIRPQIVRTLAAKPAEHEMKMFSRLLDEKDEGVQHEAIQGLENLTGMRMGEGVAHVKVVKMWRNYFNRPASVLR